MSRCLAGEDQTGDLGGTNPQIPLPAYLPLSLDACRVFLLFMEAQVDVERGQAAPLFFHLVGSDVLLPLLLTWERELVGKVWLFPAMEDVLRAVAYYCIYIHYASPCFVRASARACARYMYVHV